jgi:hypothetical protein
MIQTKLVAVSHFNRIVIESPFLYNNCPLIFCFKLLPTFRELKHGGKVCNLAINLETTFGSYMKARLQTLPPA